jgi:hypothetical protein
MIDFKSKGFLKLKPIDSSKVRETIQQMLLDEEKVFTAFQAGRDQLVFTTKRIVAANVQGLTGSKVNYTSIPYSKIQAFSVETAGALDRDCELEIYISSIGKIRFELTSGFDIVSFNKLISQFVL